MDSYPICKNGEYYELSTEICPNMVCGCWGGGKEWSCRLTDIIYPLALRLKQEYDVMEANTKREEPPRLQNEVRTGDEYECYHSLYDIWIEEVIVDTDNLTVEMIVGS